jgi:nucleoside phosphorylase
MSSPQRRDTYGVGVICALPLEKAAVTAMFDELHQRLGIVDGDENDYDFGRIGQHDVVVACLPAGVTGKASAAVVAANMMRSFPIKIGLMVGIGGGVPSKSADIWLGDVVVSQPSGQHGGVVQWDFGKMEKGGKFRRTGTLNKPPKLLLNALSGLQARHEIEEPQLQKYLTEMLVRWPKMTKAYSHQGRENDWLFEAGYQHGSEETCNRCDQDKLVARKLREDEREIVIHYGNIASGDEVMKDGEERDRIAAAEGIVCFEMEASGLMDSFPCLVIRGICDYADSHKHKRWQRYAAATAAAYAKELLSVIPVAEVAGAQTAQQATRT